MKTIGKKNILKAVGASVAVASMMAVIGVAPATATSAIRDYSIFFECATCGNRIESAEKTYAEGVLTLDIMNAVDKKGPVYAVNDFMGYKKYDNVNLDFSKFRNEFSPYDSKPMFSLAGNFSPAVGSVVAATRGHIVSVFTNVNITENFNSKKVININNGKDIVTDGALKDPDHRNKYIIPRINVNGDDSSVSVQVANIVWPNNQGAKHVYYVMPNNVDAVSAGMFGDGPVIVLGANGAKPQGAFNNLPAVCVGGPACSAPGMENAEKIVGKDRYETNYLVNKKIFEGKSDKYLRYDIGTVMNSSILIDFLTKGKEPSKIKKVIIASGTDNHIVDSAAAGVSGLPVIIMDANGNNPYISEFKNLIPGPITAYASGGKAAISDAASKNISAQIAKW